MDLNDRKYARAIGDRANAGAGMQNMAWLLEQMIRVPLTAFAYTIEVFITSMRGIQRTADQVIDVAVGGSGQMPGAIPSRGERPPNDSTETGEEAASTGSCEMGNQQSQKEQTEMDDREIDLRGDDLKLLQYDIWFTRADLESYLDGDNEVIAYSTNLGDYKGAKKSRFLRDLDSTPIKRPSKWLENEYPDKEYRVNEDGTPNDFGAYFNDLPTDDVDEYLKVSVQLLGRQAKDEKDESERLKDINKTLKGTLTVKQI